MSPFRFACLVLPLMISVLTSDACLAQSSATKGTISAGSAILSNPNSAAVPEIMGATTGGEFSSVGSTAAAAVSVSEDNTTLQSAGCGTIGLQQPLQGANNYQSPMVVTADSSRPESRRMPPIPTLLFFTLTITASAWGLRDMGKRRRITIINAGVVAASVVMAAGFTWSLFHQDEVEYGHFTQAGSAAANLAYIP